MNTLCSDLGAVTIYDPTECENAAEKLKLNFQREDKHAQYPRGCYLYNNWGSKVYYNPADPGSAIKTANPICESKDNGNEEK